MRPLLMPLAVLLAACQVGTKPSTFPPAVTPNGVTATIRTVEKATVTGELLAVEDSALLVWRAGTAMARVPLDAIELATFAKLRVTIDRGHALSRDDREQLRLTSRFPQGIREDTMARLLEASGAQAVEEVR
jgi:hypothetical protein